MQLQTAPTIREVIHHDWARRPFTHLPDDARLHEHLEHAAVVPGTSLDHLLRFSQGTDDALLVARDPAARRLRLRLWHGRHRIHEETFYGLFGPRFQRIRSESFRLLLPRIDHFFIAQPSADPVYLLPLPQFVRLGVSVGVLEQVLDARVLVPQEGLYARAAHVPSLRVYAHYDGTRYGESTRKLFYDQNGHPVAVELVAREVLRRLGYEAVPPALLARLFFAVVGRPPVHFRPGVWPDAYLTGRLSPFEWVARAQERIQWLRDAGHARGSIESLEALARQYPYRLHPPADGALPLVSRYLTRARLESFLETVGEARLLQIFEGFLRGYHVVSADWFAYMEGTRRVFPCEVKARGDHLRPYQKESILYCQRRELLDYRLLEFLHNPVRETLNPAPA